MLPFDELKKRAKEGNWIRVGVVGAGYFGSGLVRQLFRTPGMTPSVVANRTPERALEALHQAGVPKEMIAFCSTLDEAKTAIATGKIVATSVLEMPTELEEIDVVSETTGNILVGADIALRAIKAGKHCMSANAEAQATVGPILKREADHAGVLYGDLDGDQPGLIKKLYDYVSGIGFKPLVLGNCKGVMKRYATPETQAAYCKQYAIQPWIATAAADGTKLNFEMCLVANATGSGVAKVGMVGVETNVDRIVDDFKNNNLLDGQTIVEYTLGIPVGVFVIGYHEDPKVHQEMRYFKMGEGPYYAFFNPHVICQFDAVPSIAEAVLYHHATITPLKEPTTIVATFAKRNLEAGKHLDGIGGFDTYGLIANREEGSGGLPIGLSEFVRLKRLIKKDEPIKWSDVEIIEDSATKHGGSATNSGGNSLVDLYFKQEKILKNRKAALVA